MAKLASLIRHGRRGLISAEILSKSEKLQPLRSVMLTKSELTEQGKVLAESHSQMGGDLPLFKPRALLYRVFDNVAFFEASYENLIKRSPSSEGGDSTAEWFLDNFHLIQQHAAEIKRFFPKSFEKTLPKISSGDLKNYPRVYEIALQLVTFSDSVVDSTFINAFLDGYQSRLALTSGELWAIPIMLKIAVLENVRRLVSGILLSYAEFDSASTLLERMLDRFQDSANRTTGDTLSSDPLLVFAQELKDNPSLLTAPGAFHLLRLLKARQSKLPFVVSWFEHKLLENGQPANSLVGQYLQKQAANQVSIANSITSLRSITSINWQEWFELNSPVHKLLSQDPTQIYQASDFQTRDRFRHEIEVISQHSELTELQIAEKVVEVCKKAPGLLNLSDPISKRPIEKHVGFYLFGGGKTQLYDHLGIPTPITERIRGLLKQSGFLIYLGSLALVTTLLLMFVLYYELRFENSLGILTLSLLLFVIPASELATHLLQWFSSHVLKPTYLPKLDFENGISSEARSLVVVHGLLDSEETIENLVEGLHVRALANQDAHLSYSLLVDFPDSSEERTERDDRLLSIAQDKIDELNTLHGRPTSLTDASLAAADENLSCPLFFLFFRERKWNESEKLHMGWERKRGKLEELNNLILDTSHQISTSFRISPLERAFLNRFRFVITLDSDTQLPSGTARRLAATSAHPLNKPIFDEKKERVVGGYSIIQPRVSVSLNSASASRYSRIFSLESGFDPYTHLVSNFYQDLAGEGSYLGKGIYDVASFTASLKSKIPENTLLSHDLFEGNFARVGFASDIEVYDDFPSRLSTEVRRTHRWIRGDWQVVPWLFSIPLFRDSYPSTSLNLVGWWKLFDNLRRSLVIPSLFLLLITSWLFLPGSDIFWLALTGLILAFPLYTKIAHLIIAPPINISLSTFAKGLSRELWRHLLHAFFSLAFLPTYTWSSCHAITVTLYRLLISREHLLEWQTAHHAERGMKSDLWSIFMQMMPALLLTLLSVGTLVYFRAGVPFVAASILILWFAAPLLARYLSQNKSLLPEPVSKTDKEYLSSLAYQTWRYFNDHHTSDYNYLVPDNLQTDPDPQVALRTSPTNIGLSLVVQRLGYDFGFDPLPSVITKIANSITILPTLERWHGHLLNWYDIKTTRPLWPRYVSSVDSGNLVASLMTLSGSLDEAEEVPLISPLHLKSLLYQLEIYAGAETRPAMKTLLRSVSQGIGGDIVSISSLTEFVDSLQSAFEKFSAVERENLLSEVPPLESLLSLSQLLNWYSALLLLPQIVPLKQNDDEIGETLRLIMQSADLVPATISQLSSIYTLTERFLELLADYSFASEITAQDVEMLQTKLAQAVSIHSKLLEDLAAIRSSIRSLTVEADFSYLLNREKGLFSIGYNIEDAKLDEGTYDLLASESRITSLVAIAKGDAPTKHWFTLGRLLGNTLGGRSLLSWSGTMFEYLMPFLFLRDFPHTLLYDSYVAMLAAQMRYAKDRGVPWGISESAYSRVDLGHVYQYKAFGVPGIGLKRGLEHDLVVAPYASLLALPLIPTQTMTNLRSLEHIGARGRYGFYESIDFTKERLTSDEDKHVVKAFFAHHLGMSLLSIANVEFDFVVHQWFHRDPSIKSVEFLLHEKFPQRVPLLKPPYEVDSRKSSLPDDHILSQSRLITSPHTNVPRTHILSNGKVSTLIDNSGSGQLSFGRDLALTRWRPDRVLNDKGLYIYLHDIESHMTWSATFQPTCYEAEDYEVIYTADKAEFKRRDQSILTRMDVTVAQEDHVEIRRIRLSNTSARRRRIEVTSFAEVVLGSKAADVSHPAFSKMFIETEFRNDLDALVCSRRPRSAEEEPIYLVHAVCMPTVWEKVQYESSRTHFVGRGRSVAKPRAMNSRALEGTTGLVLDPIVSLRTVVELEPGATEELSFITGIAFSIQEIEQLVARYRDHHHVSRAFDMSWSKSSVEIRNAAFTNKELHLFQVLGNYLLFPISALRGSIQARRRNQLSQDKLWRLGISGDFPLALVRLSDVSHTPLAKRIVLAHYYLRSRGFVFELLILVDDNGSYMQQVYEEIEAELRSDTHSGVVDQNGGIFLRHRHHLSVEEQILVEAHASVILDGTNGDLEEQIFKEEDDTASWAPFSVYRKRDEITHSLDPSDLSLSQGETEFGTSYGGFSSKGRAFTVDVRGARRPPLPWSNILANPDFGTLVTESGGGYTWSGNCRENRITPWSNDPVSDPLGEIIYLRDRNSREVWTPTPGPGINSRRYLVEHGFGSSTFKTSAHDVASEVTISVSSKHPLKWWHLRLENQSSTERIIDVYLYIEWVLGVNRDATRHYLVPRFHRDSQSLSVTNAYRTEFSDKRTFIGSSSDVVEFGFDKESFVGRNGTLRSPRSLFSRHESLYSTAKLTKEFVEEFADEPCGILRVKVKLRPHSSESFTFFLAEAQSQEEAIRNAIQFRSMDFYRSDLEETLSFWKEKTSAIEISTPAREFDIMMNGWFIYQTIASRLFARTGFYQSGGAFGFRDQLQDVLAVLPIDPESAKNQILLHAAHQFEEGDVQHWWHPPTDKGVRTKISDDLVWLPYVTCRYIETTGDLGILDQEVPFLHAAPLGEAEEAYFQPAISSEVATLFEHCKRALRHACRVGRNGIPLIGTGDWNDGMNKVGHEGHGESIWLGWFVGLNLRQFAEFAETRDHEFAQWCKTTATDIFSAINHNGWDGEWYRRAYFDDGTPLGSKTNDECQIDSISQTWGLISGGAPTDRAEKALDAVYEQLVDKDGGIIKLLAPPFDEGSLNPGYIKGYLPGVRENGGQYTHAATWVIIAQALLGRGEEALELFNMILPVSHSSSEEGVERYQGEPYVMCGDVYGVTPHVGRAGWSWYTGSAGWMYTAGLHYILGVRFFSDHITISPCIPSSWPEFKVVLTVKECSITLSVKNPLHMQHGVRKITVNGETAEDGRIPLTRGTILEVEVVMG